VGRCGGVARVLRGRRSRHRPRRRALRHRRPPHSRRRAGLSSRPRDSPRERLARGLACGAVAGTSWEASGDATGRRGPRGGRGTVGSARTGRVAKWRGGSIKLLWRCTFCCVYYGLFSLEGAKMRPSTPANTYSTLAALRGGRRARGCGWAGGAHRCWSRPCRGIRCRKTPSPPPTPTAGTARLQPARAPTRNIPSPRGSGSGDQAGGPETEGGTGTLDMISLPNRWYRISMHSSSLIVPPPSCPQWRAQGCPARSGGKRHAAPRPQRATAEGLRSRNPTRGSPTDSGSAGTLSHIMNSMRL